MSRRERFREENIKKRILLNLFRKVVRSIVFNCYWLTVDEEELGKKKHISLVMRRKRKIGALTAADKAIIRMRHKDRTIADRKQLCNLFARLRCFSRFPPKIRARLVPVTKVMSVATGRVILGKGDVPFTIYFILTGEVEMMHSSYNKSDEKGFYKVESIFGPGDCIGDVAIVQNTLRNHVFIAASHCELLVVYDNGLPILEPFMRKLWAEKKRALKALDYFAAFNEEQIVNACRFGTIRQFNPLETIYSRDEGSITNVHFVLSGECIILQSLNMKVTKNNGKKIFKLPEWTYEDSAMLVTKTSSLILNIRRDNNEDEIINLVKTPSSSEAEKKEKQMLKRMGLRDVDRLCGFNNITPKASQQSQMAKREGSKRYQDEQYDYLNFTDKDDSDEVEEVSKKYSVTKYVAERNSTESTESEVFTVSQNSSITSDSDFETQLINIGSTSGAEGLESHYIDVGSLTFGGIFGLGEKMEDRVILARTTVQCLTLPRFFLMEKAQNPGNIWQRRLFYLDCTIPSREALFAEFLRARKWREFKRKFIYKNIDSNVKDITKNYDIPIICRIVETVDDDE